MQVASHEENQQLAALAAAAAATVFSHFPDVVLTKYGIKLYMGVFETQMEFCRVEEQPKRTPDEEVMVVRSWRTSPKNLVRRTSRGLLFLSFTDII